MGFIVVGTNHKYSSVPLREKLFIHRKKLKDAVCFLKVRGVLNGAVIVSTCNRLEIYASAGRLVSPIREIEDFISIYHKIDRCDFSDNLYRYEEETALRHLFSVTCGLDSLIVGETQILGQVKFSFLESLEAGFNDDIINKAFRSALSVGGKIHSQTKISEGKVSAGSVAVDFVKKKLTSLKDKTILIIGVGKITELVLKYLKKEATDVIFISNRDFNRACELAGRIDAKAVRFSELKRLLKKADVLISATGSPHFIITKEILNSGIGKILLIDLALPRDIDPSVKEIRGVELFCLDDIVKVIEENKKRKISRINMAEKIVDTESEKIWKKITALEQEKVRLL